MRKNKFFDIQKLDVLSLDEIARQGAQEMLRMALSAEIGAYLCSVEGVVLPDGRSAVVRNGNHRPRFITVGSGQIEAVVPRTRDRRPGSKDNFMSSIIPPYMSMTKVLGAQNGQRAG